MKDTSDVLTYESLAKVIEELLGPDLIQSDFVLGELTLTVFAGSIMRVLTILRDNKNCLFKQLIDISSVDYPDRIQRFDVVYHLLSVALNQRIRVKLATDGLTPISSVTGIYTCANWYEREVWDMMGIPFSDHPDLRRLLTDYNFDGHPLRKDFPLTGFYEVRYDDDVKRVVYEPVSLSQDYRNFDFLSPWEGMNNQISTTSNDETPAQKQSLPTSQSQAKT